MKMKMKSSWRKLLPVWPRAKPGIAICLHHGPGLIPPPPIRPRRRGFYSAPRAPSPPHPRPCAHAACVSFSPASTKHFNHAVDAIHGGADGEAHDGPQLRGRLVPGAGEQPFLDGGAWRPGLQEHALHQVVAEALAPGRAPPHGLLERADRLVQRAGGLGCWAGNGGRDRGGDRAAQLPGVLQGEVDAFAAEGRHHVRRVADARDPRRVRPVEADGQGVQHPRAQGRVVGDRV